MFTYCSSIIRLLARVRRLLCNSLPNIVTYRGVVNNILLRIHEFCSTNPLQFDVKYSRAYGRDEECA